MPVCYSTHRFKIGIFLNGLSATKYPKTYSKVSGKTKRPNLQTSFFIFILILLSGDHGIQKNGTRNDCFDLYLKQMHNKTMHSQNGNNSNI